MAPRWKPSNSRSCTLVSISELVEKKYASAKSELEEKVKRAKEKAPSELKL